MRLVALIALVCASCLSIDEDTAAWQPANSITGALAPELGTVPAQAVVPDRLRLATWNVHFGEDAEGLAANILASSDIASADVLLIQEMEAYPDEPVTRTRRFAEALGMSWVWAPARVQNGGTHGIALLSRFPLENAAVMQLPFIDTAYQPRQRNAVSADVVVGDTRIRIVNVHLDVRIGPVDRIRQMRPTILGLGDPVVLGGDFNSNPWAWIENTVPLTGTEAVVGMDQAMILDDYLFEQGFAGAMPADTATMRIPVDMRIDNLYSRGLPIVRAGVEHVDGSDHWPVWTELALD
jgi:endonuclease/exonuclease/phosphatase family metal-dependent hydrolase